MAEWKEGGPDHTPISEEAKAVVESALARRTELFDASDERIEDFSYVARVALQAAQPHLEADLLQGLRERVTSVDAARAFQGAMPSYARGSTVNTIFALRAAVSAALYTAGEGSE